MENDTFVPTDWDEYARCYDTLLQLTPYQNLITQVAEQVATIPQSNLLDIGCGTGNLLAQLATTTRQIQLTGIDFSPNMLRRARQKCAMRANFVQHNINCGMPFANETFDIVTMMHSLYALDEPAHCLREVHRILKPHGVVIVVTPKSNYDNGLILKEHAGDTGPDAPWLGAHASPERESTLLHRAIANKALVAQMQYVAKHNRLIARTARFHFFSDQTLEELLRHNAFQTMTITNTYAKQSLFAIARKD